MSKTQHQFSMIPNVSLQRSVFNRTSEHKTTFDAGYLIPFYVDEALPGDTFKAKLSLFARLATPLKPIMDNIFLDVHFFAVPNRLVWDNWQAFCGEREDPVADYNYDIPVQIPHVSASGMGGFARMGVFDYMGIPVGVPGFTVGSLHMRAYNLIWNTWYRDENLQNHCTVRKTDSGDLETDFPLRRRNKRHDYFTSALPWPQKGPSVGIPIGSSAPVFGTGSSMAFTELSPYGTFDINQMYGIKGHTSIQYTPTIEKQAFRQALGGTLSTNSFSPAYGAVIGMPTKGQMDSAVAPYADTGLYADLNEAQSATINQLRQAFQIQHLFERDARGGTRYIEILKSHFGVTSPDFRLQRPEYIGGGTISVNINPVQQTSSPQTNGDTPQGNLAAYGFAASHGIGFSKSFVEHTLLIGIISCRATLTYQQGLNRMFMRLTREDFYWPALAHLGEQPVYNIELMAGNSGGDVAVFGYQERYAEYRYKPSLITGLFRSNHPTPLDSWHLAQVLDETFPAAGDAPPTLNSNFIQENPPIDRVIADPADSHFIMDTNLQLTCARPMPVYSEPGLIDHF